MNCDPCRQQLLPFLYDLLDPHERDAVSAHVEVCADCQAALVLAQEQQGLLGEAVKQGPVDIVFKAPSKATPASAAPTVALDRPRRRVVWLNRWSVAAALLFVFFTAGSALGWAIWRDHSSDYDAAKLRLAKARDDLVKSQDELNQKKGQTQQEIRAIQEQIDTLFGNWKKEEDKTRKVLEEKGAQIILKGPQAPLAGANNPYEVQLRNDRETAMNLAQQQLPGTFKDLAKKSDANKLPGVQQLQQLNVRVINERTKAQIFQQDVNLQGQNNEGKFALPSNLPFKPGENYALEFETQTFDGKRVTLSDRLKLDYPEYVTHLATDRPRYRPGDVVRFRSLTLERFSLKPAQEKFHLRYRIAGPDQVELYDQEFASAVVAANGKPVKGPDGNDLHCLGVGEFALPANLADGQYVVSVSEVNERFNEEKRTFHVQRPQTARFQKDVQFHRSSYGPGDQFKFKVQVTSPQVGRREIRVTAQLTIDGETLQPWTSYANAEGIASFDLGLPNQIAKGVGAVTLECDDGIAREQWVRQLPLVVRNLEVEFFPEGGELIAGAANRVYFQARTPAHQPTDLIGRIVDEKDQEVARLHTTAAGAEPALNQGLGTFTFTPQFKKNYKLRIESPIGIERAFSLPEVKKTGVVMHVPHGVVERDIEVRLHSVGKPRDLLVGAYCRGRMLDHKLVRAPADLATRVVLAPTANVGGVYRITVFERTGPAAEPEFRPLAERLVYRKSAEKLNLAIQGDRKSYQPGEKVNLNVQATTEQGNPAPALAMLAVVDKRVQGVASEKTARSLPTHFLLTTEVRNPQDLEFADFLLSDNPKAALALDLLLGSQGWRRFAEQNPQVFQRKQPQSANFLANSLVVTQSLETEQKQIEKLDQAFVKQAIEMQKTLAETESKEAGPAESLQKVASQQAVVRQALDETVQVERRLKDFRAFLIQFAMGGALLTLLFVGFFLVSMGIRRLTDGNGNPRAWFTAGLALLGLLFGVSVIGTFAFMGENVLHHGPGDLDRNVGAKIVAALPEKQAPRPGTPVMAPDPEAIADDVPAAEEVKKLMAPPGVELRKDRGNDQIQKAQAQEQLDVAVIGQNLGAGNADKRPVALADDGQEDRLLRRQGNYQAILLKQLGRRVQLPAVNDPCLVREYAHRRADAGAETIYWHPALVMPDGKTQVAFDLADAIRQFDVLVQAHGLDGRLGADRIEIAAHLPVRIDAAAPAEIGSRDEITIPVTVRHQAGASKKAAGKLSVRGTSLKVENDTQRDIVLDAGQQKREAFQFTPTIDAGDAVVRIVGKFGKHQTAVERRIKVVPDGFPIVATIGGALEVGAIEHEITLPDTWIPGSLQVQAHFYPSPLAELQGALADLQREPMGTLEQRISRAFLDVMVLEQMKRGDRADPFLEKRIRQSLLAADVKHAGKGKLADADWFLKDAAPHDARTAWALWKLHDQARFGSIDADLLHRGTQFLLDARDGAGGFGNLSARGPAPATVANAYLVWILTEISVSDDLDQELKAIRAQAKASKDPYLLAVAALGQLNRKNFAPDGNRTLQQLRQYQAPAGVVAGAESSVTGSQGRNLDVETTSLALLGWLKADRPGEFSDNIQNAVKWLHQQRRGSGSFGNAHATVLALKALHAHERRNPRSVLAGDVQLSLRGQSGDAGQDNRAAISSRSDDVVTLTLNSTKALRPGKNIIQLNAPAGGPIPYTLTWSYRTQAPPKDALAPITLTTKLDKEQAKVGDTIVLTATVQNVSGKKQAGSAAVIGLPAGLTLVDENQLKGAKIAAWEQHGRELAIFWRELPADARIEIKVDLRCELPGVYRGPASQAYPCGDGDRRSWSAPLNVRIDDRR